MSTSVATSTPRAVGVLVVYSPAYVARATDEMQRLLARIAPTTHLILVNNNPSLALPPGRFESTPGSNTHAEFSGWDEGVAHARTLGLPWDADDTVLVFANDTFPFHRPWGPRKRARFAEGFRACLKPARAPALVGHVDRMPRAYTLAGGRTQQWVSTALFGFRASELKRVGGKLGADSADLVSWVPGGADGARFFGDSLDPALRVHLQRWLFEPRHGWRNAAPLSDTNATSMQRKAWAILNEKALSARWLAAGGGLLALNHLPRVLAHAAKYALSRERAHNLG